jgi:hypothetical protein
MELCFGNRATAWTLGRICTSCVVPFSLLPEAEGVLRSCGDQSLPTWFLTSTSFWLRSDDVVNWSHLYGTTVLYLCRYLTRVSFSIYDH